MTEHNHELRFAEDGELDYVEGGTGLVTLILDKDCPRCQEIEQGYIRNLS